MDRLAMITRPPEGNRMSAGSQPEATWHLGTWLDKSQTEDGVHLIRSVRELRAEEYEETRSAIGELHQLTLREAFVHLVGNRLDYERYEASIWEDLGNLPLYELQTRARSYGEGLRSRFLNWLLSVKAFLDLTQAQLTRRYGAGSDELTRFEQATKSEYDSHFSYRFIYKLRNFAQHSAFPPLEGRVRVEVDDETDESVRWLELYLDRDKLLDQWSEWTSLKEELQLLPAEIPVDEHMESAMDSITKIAAIVREIDYPALKEAGAIVNALWDEATVQAGTPFIGKIDPTNPAEIISPIWLFKVRFGEEASPMDEERFDELTTPLEVPEDTDIVGDFVAGDRGRYPLAVSPVRVSKGTYRLRLEFGLLDREPVVLDVNEDEHVISVLRARPDLLPDSG
jgi:hypothetical protein